MYRRRKTELVSEGFILHSDDLVNVKLIPRTWFGSRPPTPTWHGDTKNSGVPSSCRIEIPFCRSFTWQRRGKDFPQHMYTELISLICVEVPEARARLQETSKYASLLLG